MAPLLSWKALAFLAVSTVSQAAAPPAASCWTYKGCYNETDVLHPLQFKILPSLTEDTTNENCETACLSAGYLLAGTADAYNCWCDNVLNAGSNKLLESYCNDPCDTAVNETCGGYYAVSVYNDTCLAKPPSPSKTIILSAAPKPTVASSSVAIHTIYTTASYSVPPVPIHTIYTTVVVPGPGRTSAPPVPVHTVTTYVRPSQVNPYPTRRPPFYSRTTEWYSQPTDSCDDYFCCLFDPDCDDRRFTKPDSDAPAPVHARSPKQKIQLARHHSKESAWWTSASATWAWGTSTVFSTSTYTITSCPPSVTSCPVGRTTIETVSVTTTICPVTATEVPSSVTVFPSSAPPVSLASESESETASASAAPVSSSAAQTIALTSSLAAVPTTSAPSLSLGLTLATAGSTSTSVSVSAGVTASASPSAVQVSGAAKGRAWGVWGSVALLGALAVGVAGL